MTGGDGKEEAFSASASSSYEDDPFSSSDEASSSSVEINVSIGFVSGNLVYNRIVFGLRVST
jgi:hypothetical protein